MEQVLRGAIGAHMRKDGKSKLAFFNFFLEWWKYVPGVGGSFEVAVETDNHDNRSINIETNQFQYIH